MEYCPEGTLKPYVYPDTYFHECMGDFETKKYDNFDHCEEKHGKGRCEELMDDAEECDWMAKQTLLQVKDEDE